MNDSTNLARAGKALDESVRAMRHVDADHANTDELRALWRTVRLVLAAAYVEHARLTGHDAADAEQELTAAGSAPWRDLIVSSSDGETEELPVLEHTDELIEPLVVLSLTAPVYRPRLWVRIINVMRKGVN